MLKTITLLLFLSIGFSGHAAKPLKCSVWTSTSHPGLHDKLLASGILRNDEAFYIKPTGQVLKLKLSDIMDPRAFDRAVVISWESKGDEILLSYGIWDASKIGTQDHMLPDEIKVLVGRANRLNFLASGKNLSVVCE
jgi:hypothetical protein